MIDDFLLISGNFYRGYELHRTRSIPTACPDEQQELDFFPQTETDLHNLAAYLGLPDGSHDDWTSYLLSKLNSYHTPTYQHSLSVAKEAVGFTRFLRDAGLYHGDDQQIWKGGLLHDIGKLAIPTAILNLERHLRPDESAVVGLHTFHAEEILRGCGYSKVVEDICLHHHPGMDVEGYLDRIPLHVKIVSIADQYSAGKEQRSYKPLGDSYSSLCMLQENEQKGLVDSNLLHSFKISKGLSSPAPYRFH